MLGIPQFLCDSLAEIASLSRNVLENKWFPLTTVKAICICSICNAHTDLEQKHPRGLVKNTQRRI